MADVHPRLNVPRPTTPPSTRTANRVPFLSPNDVPTPLLTSSHQSNLSSIGPLSPVNQNGSFAWDRVIKEGKVQRRVKKKGAWKPSWKPAYLVLRPNLLSVYKEHDETGLRASITLSDVTAVAPVKKTHTDHVFGVFTPAKNYHFAGVSARDTADWISQLRLEAHTEEQGQLEPPSLTFNPPEAPGYETTDMSADDIEQPGSPEVPQWSVRGNKSRSSTNAKSATTGVPSGAYAYSANEQFTTSQSDFSDALSSSAPGTSRNFLSGSLPKQPSILPPIADDGALATPLTRPVNSRSVSQMSDLNRSTPSKQQAIDPSRVVRHGHLQILKTTAVSAGVKQWKSIWMVLRASSLSIYKSRDEYTPTYVIQVYNIIDAAEIDTRSKGRYRHKENCFQVICVDKTYRLCAENEETLEAWLGAFKSVLVKNEAERNVRNLTSSVKPIIQEEEEEGAIPQKVTAGMGTSNLNQPGQPQQYTEQERRPSATSGAGNIGHNVPSTASAR